MPCSRGLSLQQIKAEVLKSFEERDYYGSAEKQSLHLHVMLISIMRLQTPRTGSPKSSRVETGGRQSRISLSFFFFLYGHPGILPTQPPSSRKTTRRACLALFFSSAEG